MTKISDEEGLLTYLRTFVEHERTPNIKDVVFLDANGQTFEERIQSYYNNSYKGGVTLLLGLFDGVLEQSSAHATYTFQGQLIFLKKLKVGSPNELLQVRKVTREELLRAVGRITDDLEQARQTDFEDEYRLEIFENKVFPVARPANVQAYGYGIDFDLTVEVGKLMYPDGNL